MKYDTATPYTASYVLVEQDNKYAFLLRANTSWMNNHYCLPSGKVEKDESFIQAAIREAKEEIGIVIKPDSLRHTLTCHRHNEGQDMMWVDVVFTVKGWEGEIVNAEPHVHSELAWFSFDDLPKNTISSVRFMLKQIQAGNTYCEYGWDN